MSPICNDTFCSDCSSTCNHRLVECSDCGELFRIRVQGKFPRIGSPDADQCTFPCNPADLLQQIVGMPFDLFTFLQRPGITRPIFTFPHQWDNLAILTISSYEEWWERQIDSKTRNLVRKSEKKGISVQEEPFTQELLHAICDIYNETPVRQGRRFQHYGITPGKALAYASTYPNRSLFIVARLDGQIVGFAKYVMDATQEYACTFHFCSYLKHRDKSVNNALIAGAVRACQAHGIARLSYSNFSYGKKTDSLAEFKANNGFEKIAVPRYYIPTTFLGSVAYHFGFEHRLRERIPETIASPLRVLRSKAISNLME